MTPPFRLDGRVAFVSGAGSAGPGWGNGKATAVLLARQGARVFCLDLHPAAAAETAGIIRAEGGDAEAFTADVTDGAQVEAAVAACVARFGALDLLVNNVGGSAPGGAEDMPEAVWDAQLAMNLRSVFLCCKHALPHLRAAAPSAIVNLASIVALRMAEGRTHLAYSAAKQGVIALSRHVAMEHAREGVRCNTVIPGLMHTPLVEARLTRQLGANDAAALVAKRHAQVPMGRMGDAWDVAHAVLFQLSREAGHVTGTELLVDGGIAARMA